MAIGSLAIGLVVARPIIVVMATLLLPVSLPSQFQLVLQLHTYRGGNSGKGRRYAIMKVGVIIHKACDQSCDILLQIM